MAEQVTNNTSSATVVSTTITTPGTTQIVASVPATNIQLASASKPQLVVQSPQQQVLILPPGATTIPQTQLSQITIRQPAQNNVQLLGHTPLQVVNQPTGPVTVVSQGQSTGSQMFYIVSPTRTVTSSKPQAVVSGNKVIIPTSATQRLTSNQSQDIVSQLGSVSSVPNAIQAQQTLVSSPAPSSTVTQILQQSPSAGTLVANSSQNALLGLSTAQSVGGLPTVVSQSPVLTTQGSVSQKATSIKVIPKVGGSLLSGQTQTGSQPVTLQLKITDPALLQKLGLQQGKGHVLNLSGMNLSNLLANQKVQLVGKSSTGTTLQTLAGQTVKIPSSISTVTQAGGNKNLQSVATNVGLPQTSSSVILKTVSTQPVTTVASVSTVVSTMATQQPITVFSSQKGQQQIVMLKQPIVSSSQSPQTLSVMGSPQAGTQRVLLQGAQKVTNSIPGGLGASFVIGNRQISSIVQQPQVTIQATGAASTSVNPVQKRITLSPSSLGAKNSLAVHDPTSANVVQTTSGQQEVSKLSVAPKQETASSELSAVCSELKSVSQSTANTLSSGVLSNTVIGSTVTAKTTSPVKAQNTVVIKSTDATVSLASSISSSVSSITAKPATTVSVGGQNFVSKFIRILPPKPGQKQTQMVISVNPNTDVNGEVKEISKELAQLQGQPKTHDTLKKLQDLQTRLQQLQVVTQLLKKAKVSKTSFFLSLNKQFEMQ